MPRAHHAPQGPHFSTWRCLKSSSTNCAKFIQLLATVWAARNRKWRNVGTMATDKQTNRQTDAPSLNSYLDSALWMYDYINISLSFFSASRQRWGQMTIWPHLRDTKVGPWPRFPPPPAAASANPHSRVIRDSLLLQCLGNCDMLTNS